MAETSYRLATYAASGEKPRACIVVDERVVDVAPSVLEVLQSWSQFAVKLPELAAGARRKANQGMPLSNVRLLAPILYPGTIFCAGANYEDHVVEMSRALNLPP